MTTPTDRTRTRSQRKAVGPPRAPHGVLRIAAVAVAIIAAAVAVEPARAHDEALIQPGAEVWGRGSALGHLGPCTLNFVFRDAQHTYIGGSARCLRRVGERAAMANREFGTVVFHVLEVRDLADSVTHVTPLDEFALIRVDRSERHRVSPVVLGVNFAPTGVKTADTTDPGDLLYMTGQGVGFRQSKTQHRAGALLTDNERGFHAAIPASLGDGGAPLLDESYNAYGVLSSSLNTNGPYGTTVERILQLLDDAGFKVELVTGYDEHVRRGG